MFGIYFNIGRMNSSCIIGVYTYSTYGTVPNISEFSFLSSHSLHYPIIRTVFSGFLGYEQVPIGR